MLRTARALLWHVFDDPAEIAEAHDGVDTLGHLRGLQTRGLTSARSTSSRSTAVSAVPSPRRLACSSVVTL
jgi:hypothetical protein